MHEAGYTTHPATTQTLTHALSQAAPTPFLSLADYAPLFATLPQSLQTAATAAWGPPEADPSVQAGHFTLRHLQLGHITAALQPGRGDTGDRRRAYHDADLPPRHAFIAFYLSLRSHHALVHLGTHGSLEWLPGKATALSPACWPRALTAGLPVIYPFIVNNPGEAAAAKRRLGAVTIGHLTPPIRRRRPAWRGRHARAHDRRIRRRRRHGPPPHHPAARTEILDRAATAGLLDEVPGHDGRRRARPARRVSVRREGPADPRRPARLWPTARMRSASTALPPGAAACARRRTSGPARRAGRTLRPARPRRRTVIAGRADVLPTGRNLAGVDPRMLPTRSAVTLAERAAADLLRRHRQDHGDWPRSIILNVWGAAAMRTGGEDIALALLLLGVRPDVGRGHPPA